MPFPASLTTITVNGIFEAWPNGAVPTGTVRFTCAQALIGPTDDVIVPPFDAEVALNASGAISVVLPSTNDPQWSPVGWSYAVTITLNGRITRGVMSLPYNGPATVNLASVISTGAVSAGQSYLLTSQLGVPNGVAPLDSSGLVPVVNLPAASGGAITAASITDSTATGRALITAVDAPTARIAIGAGTSSLALGATGSTAAAGNHQHVSTDITDSTAVGRAVLTAADAPTARTAIGAGTSSLALGTTGTTAAAGNHTHAIADVSGLQAALNARTPLLVLGPSTPVPGGTAAGTVIVRTTS